MPCEVFEVPTKASVNAHRAGIHAVDYKPGFQATVPLLMLAAEYITMPGFETFIRGKAREGILRRIIIDEMYIVLLDGTWRNCMDTVHWIIELNVPIFGLTATLPLHLNGVLSQRLSLPSRNAPTVVCSSTERASISYSVRRLTPLEATDDGSHKYKFERIYNFCCSSSTPYPGFEEFEVTPSSLFVKTRYDNGVRYGSRLGVWFSTEDNAFKEKHEARLALAQVMWED
jgi:hypothetical protein